MTGVIGDGPSFGRIDDLFARPVTVIRLDRRVPFVRPALLARDVQAPVDICAPRAPRPLKITRSSGQALDVTRTLPSGAFSIASVVLSVTAKLHENFFELLWSHGYPSARAYRQSPLEAMAYDAETAFASSTAIFDVEKMVAEKLGL